MNSRFSTNFVQVKLKKISNTAKILQRLQFFGLIIIPVKKSQQQQTISYPILTSQEYLSIPTNQFTQFSTTICQHTPVHYTTNLELLLHILEFDRYQFFQFTTTTYLHTLSQIFQYNQPRSCKNLQDFTSWIGFGKISKNPTEIRTRVLCA